MVTPFASVGFNRFSAPPMPARSLPASPFSGAGLKFGKIEGMRIRMSGYPLNPDWESSMLRTIDWGTTKLNNGGYRTCRQLFDDMSAAYSQYIRDQDKSKVSCPEQGYVIRSKDQRRFGLPRKTDHWSLFLEGRYTPYIPRVLKLMGLDSVEEAQGHVHDTRLVTHANKIIKLTRVQGIEGKLQWVHSPRKNAITARNEAEIAFKKLKELKKKVSNEDTLTQATEAIATIHWLYVHATPILRGTAGSSDLMAKVLFNSLKIDVPHWKEGLAPDLEALVTPLELYKKHYKNFFDGDLKFESLNMVA